MTKVLVDPLFGKLTWYAPLALWTGELRAAGGETCELNIDAFNDIGHFPCDEPPPIPFSEEARRAFVTVTCDIEEIRRFTASRLLEGNLEWGNRDDPTVNELVEHLIPSFVGIEPDGSIQISFHDPISQIFGLVSVTCAICPDGERHICINS